MKRVFITGNGNSCFGSSTLQTAECPFRFWKYGSALCKTILPLLEIACCSVHDATSYFGNGILQSAEWHFLFWKYGIAVCRMALAVLEMPSCRVQNTILRFVNELLLRYCKAAIVRFVIRWRAAYNFETKIGGFGNWEKYFQKKLLKKIALLCDIRKLCTSRNFIGEMGYFMSLMFQTEYIIPSTSNSALPGQVPR